MSFNQIVVLSEFFSWPLFLPPEIAASWECLCLFTHNQGWWGRGRKRDCSHTPAQASSVSPWFTRSHCLALRVGVLLRCQVCLQAQRVHLSVLGGPTQQWGQLSKVTGREEASRDPPFWSPGGQVQEKVKPESRGGTLGFSEVAKLSW